MMGWSMGYLYLIVPVSAALMFLFALRHLIVVLKGGYAAQSVGKSRQVREHVARQPSSRRMRGL